MLSLSKNQNRIILNVLNDGTERIANPIDSKLENFENFKNWIDEMQNKYRTLVQDDRNISIKDKLDPFKSDSKFLKQFYDAFSLQNLNKLTSCVSRYLEFGSKLETAKKDLIRDLSPVLVFISNFDKFTEESIISGNTITMDFLIQVNDKMCNIDKINTICSELETKFDFLKCDEIQKTNLRSGLWYEFFNEDDFFKSLSKNVSDNKYSVQISNEDYAKQPCQTTRTITTNPKTGRPKRSEIITNKNELSLDLNAIKATKNRWNEFYKIEVPKLVNLLSGENSVDETDLLLGEIKNSIKIFQSIIPGLNFKTNIEATLLREYNKRVMRLIKSIYNAFKISCPIFEDENENHYWFYDFESLNLLSNEFGKELQMDPEEISKDINNFVLNLEITMKNSALNSFDVKIINKAINYILWLKENSKLTQLKQEHGDYLSYSQSEKSPINGKEANITKEYHEGSLSNSRVCLKINRPRREIGLFTKSIDNPSKYIRVDEASIFPRSTTEIYYFSTTNLAELTLSKGNCEPGNADDLVKLQLNLNNIQII